MHCMSKNRCTCGRGADGKCDDSHSLTPDEWELIEQERLKDNMIAEKKIPQWVKDKEKLTQPLEEVVFVGATKTAGIKDGKLPDGTDYLWVKRRSEDGKTKYVKRER